jgi:PST family polysaccharide transporter
MTDETAQQTQISEHEFTDLKKRSLSGMASLLKRQVIGSGIMFLGNIALARILVPEAFGIYAIVAFVVQFFSIFSDVGIGAALIQKKERLTDQETSTLFWLQQMLSATLVTVIFLAAPLALHVYASLPSNSVWLIRCMAISFLLASLKTVPAILMERSIDFRRISIVEIAEIVTFQGTAISLALAGFGVWSFILAALGRGIVGTGLIYLFSPWRPAKQFHPGSVKDLLHFGINYQGTSILSFIKDAVTPLFVGAYAGAAAVGYVNWARDFAFAPLAFSQVFGRVAFPAFSRLQHDKVLLREAIERSIRMITLVMFPFTAIMMALAPDIIRLVFSEKWMRGITAFYFYCTSPFLIGIILPLYSAIMSLGKSDILIKMAVLLLFLEWGMGIPFVMTFGFTGITFNQPIITLIFLYIYRSVLSGEGVTPDVTKNIGKQGLAAWCTGGIIKLCSTFLLVNLFGLIALFCLGCLFYLTLLYFLNKEILLEFRSYVRDTMSLA